MVLRRQWRAVDVQVPYSLGSYSLIVLTEIETFLGKSLVETFGHLSGIKSGPHDTQVVRLSMFQSKENIDLV